MAALSSCQKVLDHNDTDCDYSVRLFYHYNRENMSRDNVLPKYVKWIDQYIFDRDGVLLAIDPIGADVCDGTYNSELMLPPGRYSVIAVGNQTSMSRMWDNLNDIAPKEGLTRREDMRLSLVNEVRTRGTRGYYDNCGRLYYGYRTFSIEQGKLSHIRVDMVHSHLVVDYTIRWKAGATPPAEPNGYYVQVSDIPSRYGAMPQYYFPGGQAGDHNPGHCDPYNRVCLEPLHHIPTVYKPDMFDPSDCNIVVHRSAAVKASRTIIGQTVTYRLRNGGDVKFSLHRSGEAGDPDRRLMKDVNLNRFFQEIGHNLDLALRQEYEIVFEIDADGRVAVFLAGVGEWDEGGGLGN